MEIEMIDKSEVMFQDLEPGTVFETGHGAIALKLCAQQCVLLTYNDGTNWFVTNATVVKLDDTVKVIGKLIGLKVQKR